MTQSTGRSPARRRAVGLVVLALLGADAGAVGDFFGYADHLELELFVPRVDLRPVSAGLDSPA
jgi:hypothetical protein